MRDPEHWQQDLRRLNMRMIVESIQHAVHDKFKAETRDHMPHALVATSSAMAHGSAYVLYTLPPHHACPSPTYPAQVLMHVSFSAQTPPSEHLGTRSNHGATAFLRRVHEPSSEHLPMSEDREVAPSVHLQPCLHPVTRSLCLCVCVWCSAFMYLIFRRSTTMPAPLPR